jgi:hypothetical protein
MLLLILIGVVGFGIYTFVSSALYQKRFGIAEKVFDGTTMATAFEAVYTEAYDAESLDYTHDQYFGTAAEWASTFRFYIVKKLTEFHSGAELKQKYDPTLQSENMDMNDLFSGMGTEGRRYALELVGDLEQKFKRDSAKAQNLTAFKRRRR